VKSRMFTLKEQSFKVKVQKSSKGFKWSKTVLRKTIEIQKTFANVVETFVAKTKYVSLKVIVQ